MRTDRNAPFADRRRRVARARSRSASSSARDPRPCCASDRRRTPWRLHVRATRPVGYTTCERERACGRPSPHQSGRRPHAPPARPAAIATISDVWHLAPSAGSARSSACTSRVSAVSESVIELFPPHTCQQRLVPQAREQRPRGIGSAFGCVMDDSNRQGDRGDVDATGVHQPDPFARTRPDADAPGVPGQAVSGAAAGPAPDTPVTTVVEDERGRQLEYAKPASAERTERPEEQAKSPAGIPRQPDQLERDARIPRPAITSED
jgi:hypothetical protein